VNPFDIPRNAQGYDLDAARASYKKHGIVVLKTLFSADMQQELRTAVLGELAAATRVRDKVLKFDQYPRADFLVGDVLTLRSLDSFQYIFFRPEVMEVCRALLDTPDLVYWGDSNIQFGEAARGFHKDNVDRNDGTQADWAGPYDLVRCGFYFQDHAAHSGGLKVRLGSHNIPNHLQGKRHDVASEFGDLVIWNMRLTHSGNTKKMWALPGVSLHPRVEEKVPAWLCRPEALRRIGAFCSVGKPGQQLDRYIQRMNEREDCKPYFRFARNASEAAELVGRYGLSFNKPNSIYGELDPAST
jgi:hypothetical protein